MPTERTTLARFLTGGSDVGSASRPGLGALVLELAHACRAVSQGIVDAAVRGAGGVSRDAGINGETASMLEDAADDIFATALAASDHVDGLFSTRMDAPRSPGRKAGPGGYLLAYDALDDAPNIGVNASAGSFFSILNAPHPGNDAAHPDYLQAGARQVCAGYAVYGPATMFFVTLGAGVHGFTLDPRTGEFVLTHPDLRIPPRARELAIDVSNVRFSDGAIRRYVDECLTGREGPRGEEFRIRMLGSLVAETHRVLMRGGICARTPNAADPTLGGAPPLLCAANPVALLVEQAGGAATTGTERILDLVPETLHQRAGLVFGSGDEVDLVRAYHEDDSAPVFDSPLFNTRGLFRGKT